MILKTWAQNANWQIKPLKNQGPGKWIVAALQEPPTTWLLFNGKPILIQQLPPKSNKPYKALVIGSKNSQTKGEKTPEEAKANNPFAWEIRTLTPGAQCDRSLWIQPQTLCLAPPQSQGRQPRHCKCKIRELQTLRRSCKKHRRIRRITKTKLMASYWIWRETFKTTTMHSEQILSPSGMTSKPRFERLQRASRIHCSQHFWSSRCFFLVKPTKGKEQMKKMKTVMNRSQERSWITMIQPWKMICKQCQERIRPFGNQKLKNQIKTCRHGLLCMQSQIPARRTSPGAMCSIQKRCYLRSLATETREANAHTLVSTKVYASWDQSQEIVLPLFASLSCPTLCERKNLRRKLQLCLKKPEVRADLRKPGFSLQETPQCGWSWKSPEILLCQTPRPSSIDLYRLLEPVDDCRLFMRACSLFAPDVNAVHQRLQRNFVRTQ